jgi:hypothetical protein
MSKPLEKKIKTALTAIDSIILDQTLKENPGRSAAGNAAEFESRLSVVREDRNLVATYLDDIRSAENSWADYLRKMVTDKTKSEAEEKNFNTVHETLEFDEKMKTANEKLRSLKKLESDIQLKLKLEQQKIGPAAGTGTGATAVAHEFQSPKLKLPIFTGDKANWPEWLEIFNSTIDANTSIAGTTKLIHLKTHLSDGPRKLIEGLRVDNPDNYNTALELLKEKFGGKKEHTDKLHLELAGLKEAKNFQETVKLSDEIERLTRQLGNYGQNMEGAPTYTLLESKVKFAPILRAILEMKYTAGEHWNTTMFKNVLANSVKKEEVVKTSLGLSAEQHSKPNKKPKKTNLWDKSSNEGSVSFPAFDAEKAKGKERGKPKAQKKDAKSGNKPQGPCAFCVNSHWSSECPMYNTVDKRVDRIRELKKCLKCLRAGHFASSCPIKSLKCAKCQGKHNRALCKKGEANSQSGKPKYTGTPDKNDEKELCAVNATIPNSGKKVLLMCLETEVFNPSKLGLKEKALIFFDSGSHRSYITNELRSALELKTLCQESFQVSAFGMKRENVFADRVQFGLRTNEGTKLILSANAMANLVSSIRVVPINPQEQRQLYQNPLPIRGKVVKPDILIGIDQWQLFDIRTVSELPSGFFLSQCALGHFISGKGRMANCLCAIQPEESESEVCGVAVYDSDDAPVDPDYDWTESEYEYSDESSDSDDSGMQESEEPNPPVVPIVRAPPVEVGCRYFRRAPDEGHFGEDFTDTSAEEESSSEDESSSNEGNNSPIPWPFIYGCNCKCFEKRKDGLKGLCSCEYFGRKRPCACRPERPTSERQANSGCKPETKEFKWDSSDESDSEDEQIFAVALQKRNKNGNKSSNGQNSKTIEAQKTDNSETNQENYDLEISSENQELIKMVSDHFSLENAGMIGLNDQKDEDEKILNEFKANLAFKNGRYQAGLLWNDKADRLPTNYKLARGRLRSILKMLKAKPDLLEQYNKIFQDQLDAGIIEEVEDKDTQGRIHYLAHQVVMRADKTTTKVRIVFDGSMKDNKFGKNLPSLNQCLHTGPSLLNDLAGILMRFRQMTIVICADLKQAFLQIELRESDRDACRFFWVKDPTNVDEDSLFYEKLRILRFRRVPFGLNCSPFLLNGTIKEHLALYEEKVARAIEKNIYVDNILMNTTEGEFLDTCQRAKEIFADAGMRLCQFMSNSKQLKLLDENDISPEMNPKILGVKWLVDADKLTIEMPQFAQSKLTKRIMLAHISKLYDPLGLLCPATLPVKLLIRDLWEDKNVLWDTPVSAEIQEKWTELMRDWEGIAIKVPRFAGKNEMQNELHVFSDASAEAMGIAIYLRTIGQEISSNLIFGKSRVRPVKFPKNESTAPRMELQALTIATKMAKFVQKELDISDKQVALWTDSSCTIERLKGNETRDRFVENRLKQIKGNWPVHHIAGEQNPADLASRGLKPCELIENSLWLKGPIWLEKEASEWPKPIASYDPKAEKKEKSEPPICAFPANMPEPEWIIDPSRHSSWEKLKRTVVFILQFLALLFKRKSKSQWIEQIKLEKGKRINAKIPTVEELKVAEGFLIESAQKFDPPSDDTQKHLKLFEKERILKCQGRIADSNAPEDAKFPIYLPKSSPITGLIIREIHMRNHHCGIGILLSILRQKYWLPQARKVISKILYSDPFTKCNICYRFKAKPFLKPEMPQLPKGRVQASRPFSAVGIDYFGPLRARFGTEVQKIWTSIFVCMSTRALHMEIVLDCSAEKFMLAYRRFVARRGAPRLINSDNGTQFVLSSKVIQKAWENAFSSQIVQNESASNGTKWTFNTERAPWMGGHFERFVGLVKHSLRRTIGKKLLNFDDLSTLLIEVETVVNNRPLTFLAEGEVTVPLRPIDFLIPYADINSDLPPIGEEDNDPDYLPKWENKDKLMENFKRSVASVDKFWRIWNDSYLIALRERFEKLQKQGVNREPIPGEFVLIEDDLPRSTWKVGKIIDVIPGRDGKIRTIVLKTSNGTLKRAVSQIYPLEITQNPEENTIMACALSEMSSIELDYDEIIEETEPVPRGPEAPEFEIELTTESSRQQEALQWIPSKRLTPIPTRRSYTPPSTPPPTLPRGERMNAVQNRKRKQHEKSTPRTSESHHEVPAEMALEDFRNPLDDFRIPKGDPKKVGSMERKSQLNRHAEPSKTARQPAKRPKKWWPRTNSLMTPSPPPSPETPAGHKILYEKGNNQERRGVLNKFKLTQPCSEMALLEHGMCEPIKLREAWNPIVHENGGKWTVSNHTNHPWGHVLRCSWNEIVPTFLHLLLVDFVLRHHLENQPGSIAWIIRTDPLKALNQFFGALKKKQPWPAKRLIQLLDLWNYKCRVFSCELSTRPDRPIDIWPSERRGITEPHLRLFIDELQRNISLAMMSLRHQRFFPMRIYDPIVSTLIIGDERAIRPLAEHVHFPQVIPIDNGDELEAYFLGAQLQLGIIVFKADKPDLLPILEKLMEKMQYVWRCVIIIEEAPMTFEWYPEWRKIQDALKAMKRGASIVAVKRRNPEDKLEVLKEMGIQLPPVKPPKLAPTAAIIPEQSTSAAAAATSSHPTTMPERQMSGARTPLSARLTRLLPIVLLALLFIFNPLAAAAGTTLIPGTSSPPARMAKVNLDGRPARYKVKASAKAKQYAEAARQSSTLAPTMKPSTTDKPRTMVKTTTTTKPQSTTKRQTAMATSPIFNATTTAPKMAQPITIQQKMSTKPEQNDQGRYPESWQDSWESEEQSWEEKPKRRSASRRQAEAEDWDEPVTEHVTKQVLWCSNKGEFWIKNPKVSPFCRAPPDLLTTWKPMRLRVYHRNLVPVKLPRAAICSIKFESKEYYTNLLGDKFFQKPIKRFENVSAIQCQEMQKRKICPKTDGAMTQKADGFYSTNNAMHYEFPGRIASLWTGSKTAVAVNCMYAETELFYSTKDLRIISPVYDTRHCQLNEGSCLVNGSRLIWKSECKGRCRPCEFNLLAEWDGEVTEKMWVSTSREVALTFVVDAPKVKSCDGNILRLSEQGYAIMEGDYMKIKLPTTRSKRQTNPVPGVVLADQLASQLTASNIAVTRAVQQLFFRECQRTERITEATPAARYLLNRTDIQARWVIEDILEVYPCAPISNRALRLRPTPGHCYKFLPVEMDIHDKILVGFLDQMLGILTPTSPEADCMTHGKHLSNVHGKLELFDTQTGDLKAIPHSSLHQLPEQPILGGFSINPLVFHQLTLFNLSLEFPGIHISEHERMNDWKNRELREQKADAEPLGALPHGLKGQIEEFFWAWVHWIYNLWIIACCIYATVFIIRDVVIPIVTLLVITPASATLSTFLGGINLINMFTRQQPEGGPRNGIRPGNRRVQLALPGTPQMSMRRLAAIYDDEN